LASTATKFQTMEDNQQYKDAEKRTMGTIEVREADSDDMVLEGYAAVFNSETDLGHFREVIKPGAFDDVMTNDVRALINHDPNLILGRTENGTLELSTDERGLKYRVKLGNQQYAKDFYESVKRGDISQSSFAFTIKDQSWNEERTVRSVDKVRQLLDVSPVTYPAYAAATVQARDQQLELDEAIAVAEADTDTTVIETQTFEPMNLNEMKATRGKHADRFEELVNVAETENRDWTNNEQEEADLCKREVERLDGKIARRQAHEDMIARQAQMGGASVSEAKEINKINRSFSLSRAVQAASFGKSLEGAEAEWQQEAAKEYQMRGLQMSGQIGIPASALYRAGAADDFQADSGDGSGFVATSVPGVIDALRTPTMAERIGVTTINNATGNLKFPRVSAKAAGTEETEVSADAASGLELDEVTLSPIRVAANTKYSKQLILQGGAQVDAMISRELAAGINETIDKAVFAKAAASAGTIVDKAGAAVASADLYNMQKAVLAAGGDLARCQYVGSPSALSILKAEAAIASVSALMEGNNIDGYPTNFTPNLVDDDAAQGAVLFGDFQLGMVLAFFGGIDLLVDPYSNAGTAQIALHVNKFYDVDVRQAGALAYTSDFIA
jgi:HK97 family phage prohead protease/HK97 family phage major capsid protein